MKKNFETLIVLIILISACVPPPSTIPPSPPPSLSEAEIISAVSRSTTATSSLKSWVEAQIHYERHSTLKRRSFNGAIVWREQPDQLRFQAFGPFGGTLFDILYDSEDLIVFIPSSSRVYTGIISDLTGMPDADILSILRRLLPGVEKSYRMDECRVERDTYTVWFTDNGLINGLTIDPKTLLIRRKTVLREEKTVATILYADYKEITGTAFPTSINISLPLDGFTLRLQFANPSINPKLRDSQFFISLPPDTQRSSLSELPGEMLK
ncbi:MAG: hypothetical protein JXD19_02565 [Deltaproteobacteria bacterium]|nr:hypothetical protein [Deltaproteobacteria bacterium]